MGSNMKKCLSWFLLIFGIVMLIISVTMFLPALRQKQTNQKRLDKLTDVYSRKVNENLRLQREIHDLERSASAAERVAREKFKYCKEGEVVIYYDPAK